MTFQQLGIIPSILNALKKEAYTAPTPIQEQAIPPVLKKKDLLGCAQTGTGKTCAFAAPILQRLSGNPAPGRPIRGGAGAHRPPDLRRGRGGLPEAVGAGGEAPRLPAAVEGGKWDRPLKWNIRSDIMGRKDRKDGRRGNAQI